MRIPVVIDTAPMNSIEDLYQELDRHACLLLRDGDIADVMVAYRNKATSNGEKQFAQWEIDAFLFTFSQGSIFSYAYAPTAKPGEIDTYPDLASFQAAAFEYFQKRAATAKNPALSARYNHLLWHAPKGVKNRKYGVAAINGYFLEIKNYLQQFEIDGSGENHLHVSNILEKAISLVAETKHSIDGLKTLIKSLLHDHFAIPFWMKHSLLKDMLKATTIFKPADFINTLDIFYNESKDVTNKGDKFSWVDNYCKTAVLIARKTGEDFKYWYNIKGDFHADIAAAETQPERIWLASIAYTSAIEAYREAGNTLKKKEVEQKLFELKPNVKLTKVRIPASRQQVAVFKRLDKFIKSECADLLKQAPEDIYISLMEGWIIPSKKNLTTLTKNVRSDFDLFNTVLFDDNKNIRGDGKKAVDNKHFYEAYGRYVYTVTLQYLFHVFVPGIRSGHLTYKNFIKFFAEKTWIGKPYLKADLGGDIIDINWLSMLSPAIVEYFVQVQAWQSGSNYRPNYMLSIDSLTLRMEGLLRNFAERLNISTTVGGKKGTQEAIMGNILDNEVIQAYFHEDDLQFFQYLFGNEGGINMRNNVAHSLYNFTHYNIDKMHLLLAALLRIVNFNVTEQTDKTSEKKGKN